LTCNIRDGLLLAYGLLNATLYASLLPLWEGFDEEFHYGYVQYLGIHHRFPILKRSGLSEEVNRSISLLPMSYPMIVHLRITGVRTFAQYFALDGATRHRLHDEAWHIPAELQNQEGATYGTNYETHHAPLAYLLMAIPDQLMSRLPLPARVLILRLMAAIAATLLMFFGLRELGRLAGLNDALTALLVFLVFSCQMFWATVAHIANDWLAVPLAVWLIVLALRFDKAPSTRCAAPLAAVFGLGLLSKAYFLVFAPLYLIAALVWRRGVLILVALPAVLAGPWYVRNLVVYGNLTARQEESWGVTTEMALRALGSIPWAKSLPFMARGALWYGNSSFTDFSVRTMNVVLLLPAIAIVLYFRSAKRGRVTVILWLPVTLFSLAMIYAAGSTYTYSQGRAIAAGPWYIQAVLPLVLCAALLGCQNSPRVGRWIAPAMAILWGYILAATWIAKLIPLYGGFTSGKSTLREIVHWYATAWPATADILDTTALAPTLILAPLLLCVLVTLLVLLPMLVRFTLSKTA
jgi:hypothetical protein